LQAVDTRSGHMSDYYIFALTNVNPRE
jgi:hypothetical protein